MKLTLALTLLVSMNSALALNCLSEGLNGPQDGADLNRCSKVYDLEGGNYINCLSDDVDGPQDERQEALCRNVSYDQD